jgi:hypothetical protein
VKKGKLSIVVALKGLIGVACNGEFGKLNY